MIVAAIVVGVAAVRDALKPGPGRLPPITRAHAYKVEYKTVFTPGVTNDEERIVERPFHSLELTRRDGKLVSGELTNDQGLYFYDSAKGWSLVNPSPQRGGNDPDPALSVVRALKLGLARVRGHETILGRTCTIVRAGSPIGETLKKPTSSNFADVCLDQTGVVLDYRWTLNGKQAETMTATSFDPSPSIGSDTFAPAPGPVNSAVVIQSRALSDDSRQKLSPSVDPPAGVTYAGGWVRVQPLANSFEATTSLLYLRGQDDLVTIDYTTGARDHTGQALTLSPGHTAYLELSLETSTLVVPDGPDATVTVIGTDPDLLIAMGRGLHFGAATPATTPAAPAPTPTAAPASP